MDMDSADTVESVRGEMKSALRGLMFSVQL